MGLRGNPYDNAKAESFMKTLKCEQVYPSDYQTPARCITRRPTIQNLYRFPLHLQGR